MALLSSIVDSLSTLGWSLSAKLGTLALTIQDAAPASVEEGWEGWHTIENQKIPTLVAVVFFGLVMFIAQRQAKAGKDIPIRRIAGLDALDEAIGRSTEMGRPVLYVPGIDEIKEIQTIYSMMILRHVAKKTAEFGTPLIVPVKDSVVMTFAEEAVKQGCLDAGRPDAFIPDNVRYLSNEQFAYCAGVAGIMNREKPAANLMLGMFFAESLILAETGFATGAIQVAGTAKQHQLPFFVAACDYTIIGEEYFAVTAYLTREPGLLGTIRGADITKIVAIAAIVIGVVIATMYSAEIAVGNTETPFQSFLQLFAPKSN
ncbi:MAG: hypothetical protein P8N09_09415 [Planctomycetota bacterium]|nr:hypothetical protein [Planctomycetota bacterium]